MNNRKQFAALDIGKFVAAILIIILHTNPFGSYSDFLSNATRDVITIVAVPFFFLTSGFLFFNKLFSLPQEEKNSYFLSYIKRLFTMYLIWSMVYFVFVLAKWVKNGVGLIDVLQYIKRFFFEGSYLTIWFLPALITAISLVYLLSKKISFKKIFIISIPFYIFACMGSSYYGLTQKIPVINSVFGAYFSFFDTIKNGVLFGFVFVALGGLLAKTEYRLKKAQSLIWSIIFFILMVIETLIQAKLGWSINGVDTKIMLLPLSLFLFLFVISLNIQPSPVFAYMRKLSLLMFLSQRLFLTTFDWVLSNTILVKNTMIYFILILVFTLCFSAIFIKLSEKVKFLKKFY